MDKMLWTFIAEDLYEKTKYIPIALIAGVLLFSLWKYVISRKKQTVLFNLTALLWCCYLVMLLYLTLLEREAGSRQTVSLKLFETFGNARNNAYVVENLLLFIPFGLFAVCFWRIMRNPFVSLVIGGICSLGIEVTQLLTQRGYFQVDDILMNSLGAVTGCLIYLVVRVGWQLVSFAENGKK